MTIPHKVCPKCGQPAIMSMVQCRRCGYVYMSSAGYAPTNRMAHMINPPVGRAAVLVLLVLFVVVLGVSVWRANRSPLIGTWYRREPDGLVTHCDIRADGTYETYLGVPGRTPAEDAKSFAPTGRWRSFNQHEILPGMMAGDLVCTGVNSGPETGTWVIDRDTQLTIRAKGHVVHYTRDGADQPPEQSHL